jgi:hypothetical protein
VNGDWTAFLQGNLASVIIAALAFVVSLVALYHSKRSADASHRSADAAQDANRYSQRSADAAELSSKITQEGFENAAKRSKAHAYWILYRIVNLFDGYGSVDNVYRAAVIGAGIEKIDNLSPVQEYLHVYGHTLEPRDREHIRIALNGIELLIAGGYDPHKFEKIKAEVVEAAMALREEWM